MVMPFSPNTVLLQTNENFGLSRYCIQAHAIEPCWLQSLAGPATAKRRLQQARVSPRKL